MPADEEQNAEQQRANQSEEGGPSTAAQERLAKNLENEADIESMAGGKDHPVSAEPRRE